MAGPRSKRKRPNNDDAPSSATTRRRQRDPVSGAEPAKIQKNEEPNKAASSGAPDPVSEVEDKVLESTNDTLLAGDASDENKKAQDQTSGSQEDLTSSNPAGDIKKELLNGQSEAPQSSAAEEKDKDADKTPSGLEETRESKIRERLKHRKLLLQRVRQSRKAAREQLEAAVESAPSASAAKEGDEEEIVSFRNMTREMVSLARKQARLDAEAPAGEKRTSLSLRRGSSVGKRMNAALSSLAPGGASAFIEEVAYQVLQPPAVAKASVVPRPPAPAVPSLTPLPAVSRATSTVMPALPQSALKAPPSIATNRGTTGQKTQKTAFNTGPRGMSSTASAPSAKPPLHTGLSGSGLPPNRLAQPTVVCAEAVSLRERRNGIRGKLITIINERQKQVDRASRDSLGSWEETDSVPPPGSSKRPYHATRAVIIKGPASAPHLPRRRTTHWDYLLEEMRWAATDFIEERKWKTSTARTLGKAISSPKESPVFPQAIKTPESARNERSSAPPSSASNDEEMEDVTGLEATFKAEKEIEGSNDTAQRRSYTEHSCEHDESARKVAKIISSMVSELSASVIDNGAFADSDNGYNKALRRHQEARKQLERDDEATGSDIAEESVKNDPADKECSSKNGEKETEGEEPDREKIFQDISDQVDQLLEKTKNSGIKSTTAKTPGLQLSLSITQSKTIDLIEDHWTRLEAGAVMSGPFAAGKTISACTLLWKHRSGGPQLLVCSPASLIRWVHELGRFDGIQRRSFGLSGGICNAVLDTRDGKETFEPGDVVVCEYSAVTKMSKAKLASFHSIVIDCRYPNGFMGSRSSACTEDADSSRSDYAKTTDIPNELVSSLWWEPLACAGSSQKMNRLMIDNLDVRESARSLESLPDRIILEVVALRSAFIVGSAVFQSRYSTQKLLLAWARKRIKKSQDSGSKFERVKKLFISLIEPFYCHMENSTMLEEVKVLSPNATLWELRKCAMPPRQRSAYERTCMDLRGSLTLNLDSSDASELSHSDPVGAVSDALLRLRRQCFHSDVEQLLAASRVRTRLGWSPMGGSHLLVDAKAGAFPRKPADSPSQPDLELACNILEGSSKMVELVSILSQDYLCSFVGENSLKEVLPAEGKRTQAKGKSKRSKETGKRVVILASLPEVQILASALLNSIGIEHELLLRPTSCSGDTDAPTRDAQLALLAWSECQLMLSRFNDENVESMSDTQVIVISPQTAAGDHGGLGIELADVIVCLDEDWSGRSELLMNAIVSRCLARKISSKDNVCKLIKLVAADSCEESFLSPDNKSARRRSGQTSKVWPWSFSPFGVVVAPDASGTRSDTAASKSWQSRLPGLDGFVFTGSNLFECSGRDLADVLSTENLLPPLLTASSDLVFLPCSNGELSVAAEMDIIGKLLGKEESASPLMSGSIVGGLDMPKLVAVLPPLPLDFPKGVMSRQDLGFLSTRVHLHRFGKAFDLQGASLTLPPHLRASNTEPIAEGGDLAEKWQKPAGKPTEIASSLLFYDSVKPAVLVDGTPQARANSYSSSFSCSLGEGALRDGNQGAEALVYFPPLFPRMLESSMLAKIDIAARESRKTISDEVGVDGGVPKRNADAVDVHDSKRPRLEQASDAGSGADAAKVHEHPRLESCVITEDEASHSNAASVLLDLSDDYGLAGIGAVPLPRDSALTAAHSYTQTSNGAALRNGGFNEWTAFLAPCDAEEAEGDGKSDLTAVELGSMILFVSKKRSRGFAGLPSAASLPHQPHQMARAWPGTSTVPALPGGGNGVYRDANGGKKMRKKGQNPLGASSAFSRLPGADQLASMRPGLTLPFLKGKDSYRHRLLISSRQTGLGNTLFEAPAFRFASVRVRKRVTDRLSRHSWTSSTAFEVGPGLPLFVWAKQDTSLPGYRGMFEVDPRLWTSIVKRLEHEDSVSGDEASRLAITQRAALHRSLVAPCRVDFGPFQCGFLASPSGMTALSPPRSRVGVTLPMGVKVLQSLKDMHQISWSKSEDKLLQRCAVRFGLNWVLASRVLSGFQDIVIFSRRDQGRPAFSLAARSCRDRWQTLARTQPSLAKEVRQAERMDLESSTMTYGEIIQDSNKWPKALVQESDPGDYPTHTDDAKPPAMKKSITFLLPAFRVKLPDQEQPKASDGKNVDAMDTDPTEPIAPPMIKPSRAFSAFRAAKRKKQVIPMTIPGVVSGDPPSIVPSHHSHMQSVQSSVAASSNGRTEMWPLQLLDAADRQRTAAAATAAEAVKTRPPSASSSRSPGSSNNSKSARVPSGSGSTTLPPHRPTTSSSSSQRPSNTSLPPQQNRATATMQNFAPPPKAALQPTSSKPEAPSPPKSDANGKSPS